MTALERLPEEHTVEISGIKVCFACDEYGACRDKVIGMAQDAQVPVEWLAERVLAGEVDADTSIDEIQRLYRAKPPTPEGE